MARGWGRSEEDQDAEKEQAKEARSAPESAAPSTAAVAAAKRRTLELSLARVVDLLSKTSHPARREALETAKAEIEERLGIGAKDTTSHEG